MPKVFYRAVPYAKEAVTQALEAGVDGLIVPAEAVPAVASMARCEVLADEELPTITLNARDDEDQAVAAIVRGSLVLLKRGWEVIPVENLLAREQVAGQPGRVALETLTVDEAVLASGILERGVENVVVPPEGLAAMPAILARIKTANEDLPLDEAVITAITPVGMGHRVCVDTLSMLRTGQGMLVGNSAAFTFLVNAETEPNEFVAPRPFRVNAGAVHAYTMMPRDRTAYLEELRIGTEILLVDHEGRTEIAVAGRLKVEKRPMLLVRARVGDTEGTVFLQNAETIRLVQPGGKAVSVVALAPGDKILCRLDKAGRHFGMRIAEEIAEN